MEIGQRLGGCAASQSQRDRPGVGAAAARCALPPGNVARHRPDRDQPGGIFRAGEGERRYRASRKPAVQGGVPHRLVAA